MKAFVASLLLFTLIITASFFNIYHVERVCDELSELLDYTRIEASRDNIEGALEYAAEYNERLESYTPYFYVLFNHSEIDRIELCSARMYEFLIYEDMVQFYAEHGQLAVMVEGLRDMEHINLNNVF